MPVRLQTKRHEGNYNRNVDRCVLVRAPEGQRVRADFSQFQVEAEYDYLFMYDGETEDSNRLLGQIDCCPTVGGCSNGDDPQYAAPNGEFFASQLDHGERLFHSCVDRSDASVRA